MLSVLVKCSVQKLHHSLQIQEHSHRTCLPRQRTGRIWLPCNAWSFDLGSSNHSFPLYLVHTMSYFPLAAKSEGGFWGHLISSIVSLLMKPSGLADRYGSVGQTTVPVISTLSVFVSSMNFFLANGSLAVSFKTMIKMICCKSGRVGTVSFWYRASPRFLCRLTAFMDFLLQKIHKSR